MAHLRCCRWVWAYHSHGSCGVSQQSPLLYGIRVFVLTLTHFQTPTTVFKRSPTPERGVQTGSVQTLGLVFKRLFKRCSNGNRWGLERLTSNPLTKPGKAAARCQAVHSVIAAWAALAGSAVATRAMVTARAMVRAAPTCIGGCRLADVADAALLWASHLDAAEACLLTHHVRVHVLGAALACMRTETNHHALLACCTQSRRRVGALAGSRHRKASDKMRQK